MTSKLAADGVEKANCPVVRVEAERLPDMNIPRSGHSALLLNGEVTVVGGHTSGFVHYITKDFVQEGNLNKGYFRSDPIFDYMDNDKILKDYESKGVTIGLSWK